MSKTYRNCQSCGMPLKKDPKGGGTEADGSHSAMFCSLCYENGNFRQPDITAEEMKVFVKEKLKEMGLPGFLANWMSRGIPKLKRWNQSQSTHHSPQS